MEVCLGELLRIFSVNYKRPGLMHRGHMHSMQRAPSMHKNIL